MRNETLFVQFFNEVKGNYFDLCNGFSDTHDLCAERGEFWWSEHEPDRNAWYREETYEQWDLPIRKGTVYLSAVYLNHLYQAYVWARKYPDIRVVVGGPVAAEKHAGLGRWDPVYFQIEDRATFPPNLVITGKSVEDWFGVPNFSGRWKLDLPPGLPAESPIYFSYTLDNRCYWSKCIYCNIALHAPDHFRHRDDMRFEFRELQHPGKKIVRLNTGSITPKYIREVLPALPRGSSFHYRTFMRPASAENEALRHILSRPEVDLQNLIFGLGIEFPSNRMLRYAGKGVTRDEVLDSLRICAEHGLEANGNVVLGWNNLTEEDLREFEEFLQAMPARSMTNVQVRWLVAHPYTEVHETYTGEPIRLGHFYLGFRVEISEEQTRLNRQAGELLERYAPVKQYNVEGLSYIRDTLHKL